MSGTSVLIVGSGAMASLFAAHLAPHCDVHMLASWPEAIEAIRRDGVLLETEGVLHTARVEIGERTAANSYQMALVLVKSWQTAAVAPQLAKALAPDGIALSLQNGLGNDETLRKHLGPERVAVGVTTYGASLDGPGQVIAGGTGSIDVARHSRLGSLMNLLRAADFELHEHQDVRSLVWGKLVINAGINPVTALLRMSNGDLLETREASMAMTMAAAEAASVASGHEISLPFDDPATACFDVARRTANNLSSMLQDLSRGAPTEIDAINGAIVAAGEQVGVPTPVNRLLWHLVRAAVGAE